MLWSEPLFREHAGSQFHMRAVPDVSRFVHRRSGVAALQLISHRCGLVRLAPCSFGVTHFSIQGLRSQNFTIQLRIYPC